MVIKKFLVMFFKVLISYLNPIDVFWGEGSEGCPMVSLLIIVSDLSPAVPAVLQ